MSFDIKKIFEYVAKAKAEEILPKIIVLLIICWILPPILMSIGAATKIFIFSVLGVIIGFLSSILFYGLIIYVFLKVMQVRINLESPSENPTQNVQQNEYTPQPQQEPEYTTVFREAENYEMSSIEEQKQFEREMFAMQHPILNVVQRKVVPFIWFLAILCIIIAVAIYLLDYLFGIKLHF